MTPRERLYARLQGKPVDRAPNLTILMMFASRYIGRPYGEFCTDYHAMVEANIRCARDFGVDVVTIMSDAYGETADYGAEVTFPHDGLPVCEELLLKDIADFSNLRHFDPTITPRFANRLAALSLYKQELGAEYPIVGWVEGPLAEMADLRGLSETMMDIYEEPDFVEDVLNFCAEQAITCAKAQIEAGADVIGVGDAAVSLVNLAIYSEKIMLLEKKIVDAIHESGGIVKLHICGEINHLMEDIWKTGADIIDVDYQVDIPGALARIPKGQIISGNINPVAVIMQGTPDMVGKATRQCLAEGGDRICISSGCEVPRDTPHENLKAIHEMLCAQGRYFDE